jgi:hypothetical protein
MITESIYVFFQVVFNGYRVHLRIHIYTDTVLLNDYRVHSCTHIYSGVYR